MKLIISLYVVTIIAVIAQAVTVTIAFGPILGLGLPALELLAISAQGLTFAWAVKND
jgi:hypothetical protein